MTKSDARLLEFRNQLANKHPNQVNHLELTSKHKWQWWRGTFGEPARPSRCFCRWIDRKSSRTQTRRCHSSDDSYLPARISAVPESVLGPRSLIGLMRAYGSRSKSACMTRWSTCFGRNSRENGRIKTKTENHQPLQDSTFAWRRSSGLGNWFPHKDSFLRWF